MLPLVTCSWRRLQVHGAKHLIYCVQPPKPPTTTWHVGRHHCRSSRCQDLGLFVNSEQPVLLWKAGGPGSMPEHKEAPITSFFPRQGTTFFPRTGQFGSSPSQCQPQQPVPAMQPQQPAPQQPVPAVQPQLQQQQVPAMQTQQPWPQQHVPAGIKALDIGQALWKRYRGTTCSGSSWMTSCTGVSELGHLVI